MKLGYVLLYVKNIQKAVDFYESAFGLERGLIHESGQYAEMKTGDTRLGFVSLALAGMNGISIAEPSPDGKPPAFELAFVSDDVTSAFNKAVRAGAEAVSEPVRKPWGQVVAYVRDNSGFLVEICSPI